MYQYFFHNVFNLEIENYFYFKREVFFSGCIIMQQIKIIILLLTHLKKEKEIQKKI